MKKIMLVSLLLMISTLANAQWRKIADLKIRYEGDSVALNTTCVYFIDLPGPPRIGFAGTDGGLWKTSDGGTTWNRITVYGYGGIEDICFKDSLTGWFVAVGGALGHTGSVIFRTTNGGDTWNWLPIANRMTHPESVCYIQSTNRLFVSIDSCIMVSPDLGNTWQTVICMDSGSVATGFSFASDSVGYAAIIGPPHYIPPYTPAPNYTYILRTFDGGVNWQLAIADTGLYTMQPLAIRGTPICFVGQSYSVSMSDDYGQTWKLIAYPDPSAIDPSSIHGDLSRLYVQSGEAMFVSTDSGKTWQKDGPPWRNAGYDNFYVGKGIAVAGMSYLNRDGFIYGGGLWEEVWPEAGVSEQEPISSSLRVFPNPATNKLEITSAPAETVRLYDLLGREVMETKDDGSKSRSSAGIALDVSKLLPGTYFLRGGTESTKVIIGR